MCVEGRTPQIPHQRSLGLLSSCVSPWWEVTKDGATCLVQEGKDEILEGCLAIGLRTKLLLKLGGILCLSFPTEKWGQSLCFLWESCVGYLSFPHPKHQNPCSKARMLSGTEGCSRWPRCFADAFENQIISLAMEKGARRRRKTGSWGIFALQGMQGRAFG